jgi:hypothetical protein
MRPRLQKRWLVLKRDLARGHSAEQQNQNQ